MKSYIKYRPQLAFMIVMVKFHGGYSHTLPTRVWAAQRGRNFEAPDLERGIHFSGVF